MLTLRRSRPAADHGAATDHPAVVVRHATPTDDLEIGPLAHRAGDVVPARPLAVAEVDGRIVAVRGLVDGVLVTPRGEASSPALAALDAFAGRR